jgi:HEPN/Toprim N-terminal domain 1
MGSINVLTLGGYPLGETKGPPSNGWLSLFSKEDFKTERRPRRARNPLVWGKSSATDAGKRETTYEFRAPIQTVIARLELLGFTQAAVEADYRFGHRAEMREHRGIGFPYELRRIGVERALKTAANLMKRKVLRWNTKGAAVLNNLESYILADNEHRLDFSLPFSDWRSLIRGLLLYLPADGEVVLDLTDQVHGGWTSAKDCLERVEVAARSKRIVVVTEGKTDTEVLSAALQLLHPELTDYFVWPDLTVRLMAGTSGVEHTLKALHWVGVRGQVLGLCDNDFEGHSAIQRIKRLHLPANIRATTYPRLATADDWPVIDASGTALQNVNGLGCSVELYFGSDILGSGAARPAIRRRAPGPGQGAIDGKDELKKKFLRKVQQSTPENLVGDWADMRKLIATLLVPPLYQPVKSTASIEVW